MGTMWRALVRRTEAGEEFLGVRFRPGRAIAFFGLPLDALTGRREPLAALGFVAASELGERIGRSGGLAERVELLERFVAARAAAGPEPVPWVCAAVDRVVRSAGRARVESLARWCGVSRQALARRFAEHVGISPKELCRVMRLKRLLALVAKRPGWSWADLAVEAGYYDQAHLIGEARRLGVALPAHLARG